jgi:hypothetical protein
MIGANRQPGQHYNGSGLNWGRHLAIAAIEPGLMLRKADRLFVAVSSFGWAAVR